MTMLLSSAARVGMGAIDSVTASPGGPIPAMEPDATQALTANAFNAGGQSLSLVGWPVKWATSNAAVATVASTGHGTALVTAVGEGTCTITPTVGPVTGTAVAFEVSGDPPPEQPELVVSIDWQGRTPGTTEAEILDGVLDDVVNNSGTRMAVVATTGLDMPAGMDNCLAVRYTAADAGFWDVHGESLFTLPTIGNSWYRRTYFRYGINDASGLATTDQHPFQSCIASGGCCGMNWWKFAKVAAGTVRIKVEVNVNGGLNQQHRWRAPTINRDQTYRLEEKWTRVSADEWTLSLRLYTSDDELLYTDADFFCESDNAPSHTLDSQPTIDLLNGSECLRHLLIGYQGGIGAMGSDDADHNRIYYAGIAYSLEDWIGPYVPGEDVP